MPSSPEWDLVLCKATGLQWSSGKRKPWRSTLEGAEAHCVQCLELALGKGYGHTRAARDVSKVCFIFISITPSPGFRVFHPRAPADSKVSSATPPDGT